MTTLTAPPEAPAAAEPAPPAASNPFDGSTWRMEQYIPSMRAKKDGSYGLNVFAAGYAYTDYDSFSAHVGGLLAPYRRELNDARAAALSSPPVTAWREVQRRLEEHRAAESQAVLRLRTAGRAAADALDNGGADLDALEAEAEQAQKHLDTLKARRPRLEELEQEARQPAEREVSNRVGHALAPLRRELNARAGEAETALCRAAGPLLLQVQLAKEAAALLDRAADTRLE